MHIILNHLDCDIPSKECEFREDYKCHDGRCIRSDWVCDNSTDCFDASDEGTEMCGKLKDRLTHLLWP